jgi:hypothetical protein
MFVANEASNHSLRAQEGNQREVQRYIPPSPVDSRPMAPEMYILLETMMFCVSLSEKLDLPATEPALGFSRKSGVNSGPTIIFILSVLPNSGEALARSDPTNTYLIYVPTSEAQRPLTRVTVST